MDPTGSAGSPAAPVREDQVSNAVSFLLNPRVRPSPTQYKREFLEKKGLTPAEITEAFRRAPEPTGAEAAAAAQQAAPPPAPAPAAVVQQAPAPAQPVQEPLRWTQVVLRLGLLVAAGMTAKKALSPYAQPYVRGFFDYCGLRPADDPAAKAAEEAHRRALAQTATALDARAAELARSIEDVKGLLRRSESSAAKAKEAAASPAPVELSPAIRSALRELREELASELRTAVEKVERAQPQAHAASPAGTSGVPEEVRAELSEIKALLRSSQQARAATSAHNVRYGLGESPASPVRAYDDGGAASGVGGTQGGVQTPSSASSSSWHTPSAFYGKAVSSAARGSAGGGGRGDRNGDDGEPGGSGYQNDEREYGRAPLPAPPQPDRYMQVLDILSQGGTPPGIMKIDDKAPNPNQPPPEAKMQRPLKPWERARAQQVPAFSFETATANGSGNGNGHGHASPPAGPQSPDSPISASAAPPSCLFCDPPGVSGIRGVAAASSGGSSSGGWKPPAPPAFSNPGAAKAFGLRAAGSPGSDSPGAAAEAGGSSSVGRGGGGSGGDRGVLEAPEVVELVS